MYVLEGPLVDRYRHPFVERGRDNDAIDLMKRSLAAAIVEATGRSNQLATMAAAMIWGACSAASDRTDTALCIDLANRLMVSINANDAVEIGCSTLLQPASSLPRAVAF